MASTGHRGDGDMKRGDEKREGEKRKREEERENGSMKMKKRRGGEADILENEEPRLGSSQDPETSSPYPNFYIGRFTIHQTLGRGGFGKVVLASFPGRNTFMAVKVVTKTRDNAATLKRERKILLKARDCPFICHLNAAHQTQDGAFFITEYLPGGSLRTLIRMCGSLNINNVRFYTAEIVSGLQFLHGHKIIHRDIKPDNIMLDRNGHIRIIDLGLARYGVTSSKKICGVAGTLYYMAPEVLLEQEYDAAADWWSLGIVVSEMSTGCSPFYDGSNDDMAEISITRDKPDIPSWLDEDLKHLIKRLLRKNPEKRLGVTRNIREHPFFNSICWEELDRRRSQPLFVPFKKVLENKDLPWPEDQTLQPADEFNYMSPSWTRMLKRSRL
ncbi:protein kinase C theta type-like [Leptodactylus fuscus]|uniref:protein kinase C theta type-like n=1 Tax=Leptodactylus fuscus TaxID=238119 RepID=UPI003F4F298A